MVAVANIVSRERDGVEAKFKSDTEDFAAAIFDLGLPSMDGLTVLRSWRDSGKVLPVLIVSARGSWSERVEGIDAGADDYLPKPFRMEEMLARLRAILRRSAGQSGPVLSVGPIMLDPRQMRVSRDGVPVNLTSQEYRLLSYLLLHAGRVVPSTELLEQLYSDDDRDSNVIEVIVGRVRRKLGLDVIETRRGFGYIIDKNRA